MRTVHSTGTNHCSEEGRFDEREIIVLLLTQILVCIYLIQNSIIIILNSRSIDSNALFGYVNGCGVHCCHVIRGFFLILLKNQKNLGFPKNQKNLGVQDSSYFGVT